VKLVHAQPDPVPDPEAEARLRAEVERAVAPYVGVAPPVVLALLREGAERYYREHPQAARIMEILGHEGRIRSGTAVRGDPPDEGPSGSTPATSPRKGRR
jgi:hypothetical protein